MKIIIKVATVGILFLVTFNLLVACSGSINKRHPAIQEPTPNVSLATVYIIRPSMLKPKGPSDGELSVSFNKEKLIDISEGAYALLNIKPGQALISTHSKTKFTNKREAIEVSRQRQYHFLAGKTYFIHIARVDEEFRGVFFDPKPITLATAKSLVPAASPFGKARFAPIEKLENLEDQPLAGDMPPAFPESLYPGHEYILKPNPFK